MQLVYNGIMSVPWTRRVTPLKSRTVPREHPEYGATFIGTRFAGCLTREIFRKLHRCGKGVQQDLFGAEQMTMGRFAWAVDAIAVVLRVGRGGFRNKTMPNGSGFVPDRIQRNLENGCGRTLFAIKQQ